MTIQFQYRLFREQVNHADFRLIPGLLGKINAQGEVSVRRFVHGNVFRLERWSQTGGKQSESNQESCYHPHGRRSLIDNKMSAIASLRGLAPRLPFAWSRTLTPLASMSRCPLTNFVWAFVC